MPSKDFELEIDAYQGKSTLLSAIYEGIYGPHRGRWARICDNPRKRAQYQRRERQRSAEDRHILLSEGCSGVDLRRGEFHDGLRERLDVAGGGCY